MRVGDVQALPFDDGSFDVVHAHQVLHHVADPVQSLREMARVATPGGLVAVRETDFGGYAWHPESEAITRWLDLFRAQARDNGGEPDAGRRLLGWALDAGLDHVTPGASVWCFADAEDRAWWAGSWADRLTATTLGEQLQSSGRATAEELASVAEGLRAWAAEPAGWFSVLHGELLVRV
ncbi:MAG: methyltransferase domain-containing protein [Nocardioides sp.]